MNKRPIIAICYDFDKTLTPTDMQNQGLLQALGFKTDEEINNFWKESNEYAKENKMEQNLAWMNKILGFSEGTITKKKDDFKGFGKNISYYPGVEEWFKRINDYGNERGIEIQHYIISCGLKEMIEGTSIYKEFKKVYASSFYYNDRGVANWVSQVVNYTNKTQYLFRIEKNILDTNDEKVNTKLPPEEILVPFRNIVYIGDSTTDVPCMTLVNSRGGYSIGVYDDENKMDKVHQMLREERISYLTKADYNENTEIDILIKNIIDKTVYNERIIQKHYQDVSDLKEYDSKKSKEQIQIDNLINALDDSESYKSSIDTVMILERFESKLTSKQKQRLIDIAIKNNQVGNIVDSNVFHLKPFYNNLLKDADDSNDNVRKLKSKMGKEIGQI